MTDCCKGKGQDCDKALGHLYEYLNHHDLSGDLGTEIKRHLDDCRSCFDRYELEELLLKRLKRAGDSACPDSLKKKISRILDAL